MSHIINVKVELSSSVGVTVEFSEATDIRQMEASAVDFGAIDEKEPVFMPVMSLRKRLDLLRWLVSLLPHRPPVALLSSFKPY